MKMVKIFSSYNMDKNEAQFVKETYEDDEQNILLIHQSNDDGDDENEDGDYDDDDNDAEFKPIEHILEPRDDDQPVKCPIMPDFSSIKEDCIWREQQQLTESPQKKAEPFVANEVDPKKHYNIFEVFQQCKEFGFS